MRINRYVASSTGLSRRSADKLITEGRIKIDGLTARTGQDVKPGQVVTLDGNVLHVSNETTLVMLNKPVGYVVSRNGQGAPTIYSLLDKAHQNLKPIGRLDKDSSGLLLLSNEGELINSLAHPSFNKEKVYQVVLDKELTKEAWASLSKGVKLEDGVSKLSVKKVRDEDVIVALNEGRNRQIRRTFEMLGFKVIKLHRVSYGQYVLNDLPSGQSKTL